MEEYDDAFSMIKMAVKHHYDIRTLLDELSTASMFERLCDSTYVIQFLNDALQNELKMRSTNPTPRLIEQDIASLDFDIHTMYNNGSPTNFSKVILFEQSVDTENFEGIYSVFYPSKSEPNAASGTSIDSHNEKTLVIVNGNLSAKIIKNRKQLYLLVIGKIECKNILLENIIEKGSIDFSYHPNKS